MGILLCEQNFRDVWRRNKSVRAEIGKILRTHTHTHAAKFVVRITECAEKVKMDRLPRKQVISYMNIKITLGTFQPCRSNE